jgi:RNA polymerase sigma-70 factor (ECF subfamily)
MPSSPSAALLVAIDRVRTRIWLIGYRMTGSREEADDLAQEAVARAIEREATLSHNASLEGWLLRIATTVTLDHLRRRRVERRLTELVDPLDLPELPPHADQETPEAAAILREDVRFAAMVALQHLPPRQRAALILHDVCDCPLSEVAETIGTNPNAAKALLNRARATIVRLRRRPQVDAVADGTVVEGLLQAIAQRSIPAFTALLDEEVWGVVDGGGVVQTATKPTFGIRAVSRQFANAERRLPMPLAAQIRRLNGEPAVVIRISGTDALVASIHLETWNGRIAALRVLRDPRRLRWLMEGGTTV